MEHYPFTIIASEFAAFVAFGRDDSNIITHIRELTIHRGIAFAESERLVCY